MMIKLQEGKASRMYKDKNLFKKSLSKTQHFDANSFFFFFLLSVKIFNKPIVCSKFLGVA
jgi:hypothetical protein